MLNWVDSLCFLSASLQELRWLVTTSWNRGAVHARFGRATEAGAYQRWAAAALQHDAGLATQYQVGRNAAWG